VFSEVIQHASAGAKRGICPAGSSSSTVLVNRLPCVGFLFSSLDAVFFVHRRPGQPLEKPHQKAGRGSHRVSNSLDDSGRESKGSAPLLVSIG
jgi:hypothetical protein